MFSCWYNFDDKIQLQVANHPEFLPAIEQIKVGLTVYSKEVRIICQLRQDEWLAKMEEDKLRVSIIK